jgi:phytol kinase
MIWSDIVNLKFVFTMLALLVVILVAEILQRRNYICGELSRKFIHIGNGLILALSTFILSVDQLKVVCGLLFIGILLVETKVNLIHSVDTVKRKSIGTYLYPLGIGLSLIFFESKVIFFVSVLVLSLADGLAALIGAKWGKKRYKIFGGNKSYLGSLVFFIITLTIFFTYVFMAEKYFNVSINSLGLLASILISINEAVFAYGLDNLTIPLMTSLIVNFWI